MDRLRIHSLCGALIGLLLTGAGCKQSSASPGQGNVSLDGAGSTFVDPLMSRWSSEYENVEPAVRVHYQSIGSAGGVRQFISHAVQFGATDAPMTDTELKEAQAPVLHVPLVMGAVVPTYNLPPLPHAIRFTPDALAGIYLGEIKSWGDAKITSANGDMKLPGTPIVVVHRSDGSGTTYVWVDYLSKVSPDWNAKVGRATSVNWPIGTGAKGNEGVSVAVRQTPGSIGYVELAYAFENKLPVASVRNRAGHFVEPTIESVTEAEDSGDRAGRSPLLHHELVFPGRIPNKRHDLGGHLPGHAVRARAQGAHRISEMGFARRSSVLPRAQLRPAATEAR